MHGSTWILLGGRRPRHEIEVRARASGGGYSGPLAYPQGKPIPHLFRVPEATLYWPHSAGTGAIEQ